MHSQRCVSPPRVAMSAVLGAVLVWCIAAARSGAQESIARTSAGVTTVQRDGRLLLEYQSQPNPYKLYISRWFTPKGVQVLRDSPHDHVHHHALMFAIGIDDVDFWSEVPTKKLKIGKQAPTSAISLSTTSSNGVADVTIRQGIAWVGPGDNRLATEARTITAHVGAIPNASLLTWQFTLKPALPADSAKLWGRHYFGLGMRLLTSMDEGGKFMTQGDKQGTPVRGSEQLTRANWCAFQAKADGKPVTIAMFDAATNPRHPATWFTMNAPFAYLAATLNLSKEPLVITRDKPLEARYGIALWDGTIAPAEIEQAYQTWLALKPAVLQ